MVPMMTKTLAEAVKQVKELPDETQDRFAFDIIDRVAAWDGRRGEKGQRIL